MKTIAVIPARGGSKRLKGKNLRNLAGKPLIAHSILYALENSSIIDRVLVSTEDPEIKDVSLTYGAEVVDRPQALSSDTASSASVLRHTLDSLDEKPDHLILLQPTNPLRPLSMLMEAFEIYKNGDYDSLMGVSPVFLKLGKIGNGRFIPFNYSVGQRSQDLDPLFYENGLLYISKSTVIEQDRILGDKHYPFVIDHPFSKVDIDYEEDLNYAEFLLASQKKRL